MAGAGYKLFNTGDVLTAAQVNTYLQEQAVMRFANSTARTTALSGVLAEGMMSYLDDTNSVEVYNGSSWVSVGSTGDITGVTAGTGISGGGSSGDVTITNSMATAIDAKGDLIVGTGADTFSRLAVGATDGHVLKVKASTSTGLEWGAAGGGTWTDYTATWTNLTKGNGTEVSRYIDLSGLIVWYYNFVFGSTSSMGTTPIVTLPVNAKSGTDRVWPMTISLLDAGVSVYYGTVDFNDDSNENRAVMYVQNNSGTYASTSGITSTVPFTWGTNDAIRFTLIYEKA